MINKPLYSTLFFLLLLSPILTISGQATINAYNLNTFILGGGQESSTAIIDLKPIEIVDLEPDPGIALSGNMVEIEAGNPFYGIGSPLTGEFWLNFTYRSLNNQNARIFASVNQPVPEDMIISLQILNTANINGVYNPNPNSNTINLSTNEQVIVYDFTSGYTGNGEGTGYRIQYIITNPNSLSLPPGFEIVLEIK